jgi:hypothetical protein
MKFLMHKFLRISLLLIVVSISPAYATIPLTLVKTFQLPSETGSWDVQHVLNDSTLTWARLSGASIIYQLSPNDSVRTMTIPPEIFSRPGGTGTGTGGLRLFKIARADSHACALLRCTVEFRDYPDWDAWDILGLFDLSTHSLIDSTSSWAGYRRSDYEGSEAHSYVSYVQYYSPWPPLPLSTRMLYCAQICESASSDPHDYWSSSTSGWIRLLRIEDSLQVSVIYSWNNIQPFSGSDVPSFAVSGESITASGGPHGGDSPVERCWFSTLTGDSVARWDSSQGCPTVVAQTDGNGTRRMIFDHKAVDPDSYAILWENSAITGTLYTACLAGSLNERVLETRSEFPGIFLVYNASDGSFLDFTSAYVGDLITILKPAARPAEFVTYESSTSWVRIYSNITPPSVHGLTIAFLPESNVLRLRWLATRDVTGYRIYGSDTPDGEGQLIAELPSGTLVYDMPLTGSMRFFHVTNVCNTP